MPRYRTGPAALLLLTAIVSTACHLQLSTDVEAKDEWSRSYPITADGTLSISTSNGTIAVEATDGDTIEITAFRTVKAGTEDAANEQLKLLEMKEEVTADRVSIDSTSRGLTINVSRRINYTVRVPRHVAVELKSSNGEITATGLAGMFTASSSNGQITATDLRGGADTSTSNGAINLTVAEVPDKGISAETRNGLVTVTVPRSTNATVTARVSNGAITHENLDLQISESSRRRLDGRLGSGGPTIRLETSNGALRLIGK